jgi:hypothetical protein
MCDALAGCGQSSGVAPTTSTAAYPAFSNPTQVAIMGYTGDAMEPFISKDGRYLFFNSRNDPSVNTDIYYAARVDDQTFTFLGPLPGVNSPELDAVASLDSRQLLFRLHPQLCDDALERTRARRLRRPSW